MTTTESDIRTRLQEAALELFCNRGYDWTTASQVAARAGVTERTFFRYFPDKREVLFDGEAVLKALLTASVADAPAELGPLDTLFRAFRSVLPLLDGNRLYSKPRQDVISVTPVLQERELAKLAALADVLADGLTARGVADVRAALAARAGMAAFAHATIAWLDAPTPGLEERVELTFRELRAVLTDSEQPGQRPSRVKCAGSRQAL